MPNPTIPAGRFRLDNARIPVDLLDGSLDADPDRLAVADIAVTDGRIAAIGAPGALTSFAALPAVDLDQGIVLPRFADIHTHLDKGHIWPRASNPDGAGRSARGPVQKDRDANWTPDDVWARMDFALRCAYAHGTSTLRTHIDSLAPQAEISWPVFTQMRAAWRDRIVLQAASLTPVELAVDDEPQFRALAETVARHGGLLGGVTFMGEAPTAKLDSALDRLFDTAAVLGLDIDLHVDESLAPEAASLERIALAALRHKFAGHILCGHCCSLTLTSTDDFTRIAGRLAEADIAIVSLPMVNMYLQDRGRAHTPRLRAVAPLHELDAAGVRVMVASDNTRDPYHAYGDLDMIEVFREATRVLHLDHSDRPWMRMFGAAAAEQMGLKERGLIVPGGPADLVLTRARTPQELLSRPQSDRVVLVGGAPIDTTPPDYRELDRLYR